MEENNDCYEKIIKEERVFNKILLVIVGCFACMLFICGLYKNDIGLCLATILISCSFGISILFSCFDDE